MASEAEDGASPAAGRALALEGHACLREPMEGNGPGQPALADPA